jgi:hypothetical protein
VGPASNQGGGVVSGLRFVLDRHIDVTHVSGTGVVAEGFEASDGTVFLRWLSDTPSSVIYDDIRHVERVHGHHGATQIRFLDQKQEPEPTFSKYPDNSPYDDRD